MLDQNAAATAPEPDNEKKQADLVPAAASRERRALEIQAKAPQTEEPSAKILAQAQAKALPTLKMVYESATRDLESAKRREGESDLNYLKRLIELERRHEKNRLVLKYVQEGKVTLFRQSELNQEKYTVPGFYNIKVMTLTIGEEKWKLRVAIDPSKHLYFKDMTDRMLDLTDQVLNETAREFNALPLAKRRELTNLILAYRAERTAILRDTSNSKDRSPRQAYAKVKGTLDTKWLSLLLDRKTFTAHLFR